MSGGRGVRGNREVSPLFFLSVRGGGLFAAGAVGIVLEECAWGKHGFPHVSEPKASDAHEYRILGLMIAYEMSTIRLTKTKTSARNRICL
jgi:hypothetical protein